MHRSHHRVTQRVSLDAMMPWPPTAKLHPKREPKTQYCPPAK
jgi:hypothetical protein